MSIDYSLLKSEIRDDPAVLGYAPLVAAGSDRKVADLLNRAGTGTLTNRTLSKHDFLTLFAGPIMEGAAELDAARWEPLRRCLADVFPSLDTIRLSGQFAATFTGLLVAANLISAEEVTALLRSPATRAEVLFGAGTHVSPDDVAKALRGDPPQAGDASSGGVMASFGGLGSGSVSRAAKGGKG